MSEKDKEILTEIVDELPKLNREQQQFMLGFATGIISSRNTKNMNEGEQGDE